MCMLHIISMPSFNVYVSDETYGDLLALGITMARKMGSTAAVLIDEALSARRKQNGGPLIKPDA